MARRRVVGQWVVAALVAGVALVAPVTAEAAPPPVTAVSTRATSAVTGHLGLGSADAWSSAGTTIDVVRQDIQLYMSVPNVGLTIWLTPQPPSYFMGLAPGTYPLRRTGTEPGAISVMVDGPSTSRSQQMTDGTITIHEVTTAPSGEPTSIAADITGTVAGAERRFELRWNSAVPIVAPVASDPQTLGGTNAAMPVESYPFTVTNRGSGPLTLGTASLNDPTQPPPVDPGFATVRRDGCSRRVLAPGESCSVTLLLVPRREGTHEAVLRVPMTGGGDVFFGVTLTAFVNGYGTFHATAPRRLLDTRVAGGSLGPGALRRLPLRQLLDVPDAALGQVLLNVTVVAPSSDTSLSILRERDYPVSTSVLEVLRGETRASSAPISPGPDGNVYLRNAAGRAHVVIDLLGWYESVGQEGLGRGGLLQPVRPTRVVDTRYSGGALTGGGTLDVVVDTGSRSRVPTAALVNLTAVSPTVGGHLTAWSGEGRAPGTSSVNFRAGSTTPNLTVVPVRAVDGGFALSVRNGSPGASHVLVDLLGWFDAGTVTGLRYSPELERRVADTRSGVGVPRGAVAPGVAVRPRPTFAGASPPEPPAGVWLNVKAVRPSRSGHVTVWSGRGAEPGTSVLNAVPGRATSNPAVSGLLDGRFTVMGHTGSTHLVVDTAGSFRVTPSLYSTTLLPADLMAVRERLFRFDVGATPRATTSRR